MGVVFSTKISLFATLLFISSLNCPAQTVYSVNGRHIEKHWLAGSGTNLFGFTQYTQQEEIAYGATIEAVTETLRVGTVNRYTQIFFGRFNVTFQRPAWVIGAMTLLTLSSVIGLVAIGVIKLCGREPLIAKPIRH